MKVYKEKKPNNYLNQYRYEQMVKANEIAYGILEEFIDEIHIKMFSDTKRYITKKYQLTNILDNILFLNERNYKQVKYCLKLSENKQVTRNGKNIEIYRYYYRDAGMIIYNCIFYKSSILKIKSKQMLKFLTTEGKRERDKLKNKAMKKLKKLQEDLFWIVDNDPTIERIALDEETVTGLGGIE